MKKELQLKKSQAALGHGKWKRALGCTLLIIGMVLGMGGMNAWGQSFTPIPDALKIDKQFFPDDATGHSGKLWLETYTTGKIESVHTAVPTDIVLVLDVSTSMTKTSNNMDYNGHSITRLRALQMSVAGFIDLMFNDAKDNDCNHRLSVITFCGNTKLVSLTTPTLITASSFTNDLYRQCLLPINDEGSLNTLLDGTLTGGVEGTAYNNSAWNSGAIYTARAPQGGGSGSGATGTSGTLMANGLQAALNVLNYRTETTFTVPGTTTVMPRNMVVVFFTDGYPAQGSIDSPADWPTDDTEYKLITNADAAVAQAAAIKTIQIANPSGGEPAIPTVYSIGVSEGVDPAAAYTTTITDGYYVTGPQCLNGLLHFISSDYDKTCTSWQAYTTNNDGRNKNHYYAATDADQLANAFAEIGSSSGGTPIDLGSSTVVQDVISESFTLPEGADVDDIQVYAQMLNTITNGKYIFFDSIPDGDYLPLDTNTGRIPLTTTNDTINCNKINSNDVVDYDEDTKTISFKHFDFSHYFCGPIEDNGEITGYRGRKLTMVIPIEIEEGVWGDGISTNGEMSFVSPNDTTYYQFPLPSTNVMGDVWTEIVTHQPDGFRADSIDSPEDLAWFISLVNGRCQYTDNSAVASNSSLHGTLTADIDMSAHNWVPIGAGYKCNANNQYVDANGDPITEDNPGQLVKLAYEGVFDGNGHVITGLKNNASKYYKVDHAGDRQVVVFPGMFANVKGDGKTTGIVKNVFVLDADFRGKHHSSNFVHHGIIADTLTGGLIYNCEAFGSITCNNDEPEKDMKLVYGGLVGLNDGGTIHSSMAMATLTAYSMGGMVGEMQHGAKLENSFTNGVYNYLGTTAGVVWDHDADTQGLFRYVGGLVGRNHGVDGPPSFTPSYGSINNCYVRFQRSNNFGDQGGDNAIKFGQLVGTNVARNNSLDALGNGTIRNCYTPWDNTFALVGDGTATDCQIYSDPTAPSLMRSERSNDNMVGGTFGSHTVTYSDGTEVTFYAWEDGTPLLDKLNASAKTAGYTPWKRTTAGGYASSRNGGNINGDYPVLEIEGFTCIGSTDGIAVDYAKSLDQMLKRHNTGNMNENTALPGEGSGYTGTSTHDYSVSAAPTLYGGTIHLYDNDTTSMSTSTNPVTMVYIDEDVSLLQSSSSIIDAYTSQTMINFNGSYNIQEGNRWHNVSSSLENSVFGWTYQKTDTVQHNWDSDPCKLWLYTDNNDQELFPSDMTSTHPFDFYCFFEPEYHWVNFKRNGKSHWHMDNYTTPINYYYYDSNGAKVEDNETAFIPGKGYLLAIHPEYFDNMHLWDDENSESAKKDRQFLQNRGTLNNGNVEIKVSADAPEWTGLKGYNLLGNPYQSYLDFEVFKTVNSNLWDGEAYANTYAVYDPSLTDKPGKDAWLQYASGASKEAMVASQYINMHQGFMIRVSKDGIARFTNAMRTNDGTPNFRGAENHYPLINFILDNGKDAKNVAVLELGRPENGGAEKLNVGSTKGRISLRHDNQDFGILFRDITEGSQPLYFDTDEDGTFTLSWNTANADFSELTLVDNLTGVKYDMLANDHYTFQGKASDYRSRFKVVIGRFTDVEENEETVTDNFAFFDGSDWIVNGQGQLTVTDMTGRTVYTSSLTNDQNRVSLNGVANGIYLMRVANGQNVNVQKIIIK